MKNAKKLISLASALAMTISLSSFSASAKTTVTVSHITNPDNPGRKVISEYAPVSRNAEEDVVISEFEGIQVNENITITYEKNPDNPDREVISEDAPVSRASSEVKFDHHSGTYKREAGSSSFDEQVWGRTTHYIPNNDGSTTLVEGYTRARWEHSLTGKIVGDSGRVWDFGMSYAESSWMSEPTFYVARTYFGS